MKSRSFFGILLVTGFLASLAVGCKNSQDDGNQSSETKFDQYVFSTLSLYSLKAEEVEAICRQSTLIVFVGNAEKITTGKVKGSAPIPDNGASPLVPEYLTVINHEANALREALGRQHTICQTLASNNPGKLGDATLLTIIDGPGDDDTQIHTTEYKWVDAKAEDESKPKRRQIWRTFPRQWWAASGSSLKKSNEGSASEVHLPTQIKSIVKEVFDQKSGGFNQTMYFFKTHGSRLLVKPDGDGGFSYPKPDLKVLAMTKDEHRELTKHAKPVFLFDSHGPGDDKDYQKTAPGIFSAYWLRENSCKQLASSKSVNASGLAANVDACLACRDINGGYTGNFSGCEATLAEIARSTQGDDSNNTTQGDDSNRTTQGDDSNNTTQGDDANRTTQGDDSNNTTQGDDSNHTTQGDPDDANKTTQGGGKGFLYLTEPSVGKEGDYFASPEGASIIASGAGYDLKGLRIKGITDLTGAFPSGNKVVTDPLVPIAGESRPFTDERAIAPTLIVLDSCYGNANIASIIKNLRSSDKNPVVVVSNPEPLYTTILNYGALDMARYRAFAFVNYWYSIYRDQNKLDQHQTIKATKEDIDRHLSERGVYDLPKLYQEIAPNKKGIAAGEFVLDESRRSRLYNRLQYRRLVIDSFRD